jgi:hypothetical protein
MALKTERVLYTAKNFDTSLTDVTANIRRNGSSVATAVALTHVANGVYQLVISPATLSGYGGAGYYDFYINSASKSAPAVAARWIIANDEDDIEAHLAGIESKVDIIDTNIDSVKITVEDTNTKVNSGTYGLAALKALIDTVQSTVSNISNVTRQNIAMPSQVVTDDTVPTRYRIPMRIYNNSGNLEDPDSNAISVSIQDESGNDRTSYIVGFVSGPVNATRTGAGVYYVDIDIPANADLEQLNFFFSYLENTLPLSAVRTTSVVSNASISGFALQSTLLSVETDVNDIQAKVNSASFGLSALKDLIDIVDGNVDLIKTDTTGILAELANGTYGLGALKTALDLKASQASVTAITTNLDDNVKGSGFSNATDSLTQISSRVYFGGNAV